MSDRDEILAAVRKQRPESGVREPAPDLIRGPGSGSPGVRESGSPGSGVWESGSLVVWGSGRRDSEIEDWRRQFISIVREIGGEVVSADRDSAAQAIEERYPGVIPKYAVGAAVEDPVSLQSMELFVCEGVLGVAENGAIWIPESNMGARVAPFIAQHLAVMLDASQIVANMHQAYERIDIAAEGFGVFVAGPSKTADIEQSLVLGAHGPRSLLVVIV